MNTIRPTNEAEIADAVREAAEKDSSFEILAGGTKREFGRPVNADAILDVSALSGILKYEPEELVLTAHAATPIAQIQAALAEKRQMLAFEPADWGPLFGVEAGRGTLGGVVATNACGSRRVKAGAVRDSVIGCRFVNGRGEIVKAGGHVIKNVTGFDLPKLMCGAFGTLGVLTEITLRVVPLPECVAALRIFCSAEEALRVLRNAASLPVDPTGLAYLPRTLGFDNNDGEVFIRVEGAREPVKQKLAELENRFANAGYAAPPRTIDADVTRAVFQKASDGIYVDQGGHDIWRLCVPSANAFDALLSAGAAETSWYADWAGGLLWLGLGADEATATTLRNITARFGGHATLMRASQEAREALPVFEPESPVRAALTRSIKAAFDPKRVLNPARMYKDV